MHATERELSGRMTATRPTAGGTYRLPRAEHHPPPSPCRGPVLRACQAAVLLHRPRVGPGAVLRLHWAGFPTLANGSSVTPAPLPRRQLTALAELGIDGAR
ncbi:hypothetical protein GCM10010393_31480 [Streptomyces gobitricini]|uniref:Uncharacterized protein n=1 Tax=Streptomyces gobitricini TaxID=68211 RepID=A0ABP5ZHT4_9ACTN